MFHHASSLLYKPIWLLYVNKVNCILLSKKKKNLSLKTISHKRLGGGVLVNIQLTNLLGDIM